MNNLHLIISNETSQTNFYLHKILDNIKYEEDNKITYDLDTSSFSSILDEASMLSLFGGNKVIIGSNFDLNKLNDNDLEYLNNYLKNINKDNIIILITSKIDARKSSYKVFKDNFNIINTVNVNNEDDIKKYIKKIVKDNGYEMTDMTINCFMIKVGNDINNINNELNKLFIYKENDKVIDNNDINLLITDNIDTIIYEFTNAILDDDTGLVMKMYNNFKLQNISFDYLIASIANTFRQALIIKILHEEGRSNADIAKYLGKKEFYVKKMLERIYKYSQQDLMKYITKLASIDKKYKTGECTINALELFLISKNS